MTRRPVVYVTRVYHFCASHRLARSDRTDAWNERTFGRCSLPGGHGHNYELEVTLRGTPDPTTGLAFDLARIDQQLDEAVISRFDHRNLSEELRLEISAVPTSEVFLAEIWDLLAEVCGPALHRAKLQETPRNTFEMGPGLDGWR